MKTYVASNFSSEFLAKFLKRRSSIELDVVVGGYNQYFQDVLDDNSELYNFKPDFFVLLLDYNKIERRFDVEGIREHLSTIIKAIHSRIPTCRVLINNAFLPRDVKKLNGHNSKRYQLDINALLYSLEELYLEFSVVDFSSVVEEHGSLNLFDNNISVFSDSAFTKLGLESFSSEIADSIRAASGLRKKCLVLDFDNTLWRGVAGEDGLTVEVGESRLGEQYLQFQEQILRLKAKGVILASCSKNNLEDAKYIFDNHPNMVLNWDDFLVHKVNWQTKDVNIREIAHELNIGEDSLVFIDDSASEREIVNINTDCTVVDFPQDLNFLKLCSHLDRTYFDINSLTEEDISKSAQYEANFLRDKEKEAFTSMNDFINSLEIKLEVSLNNSAHVERIHQLVNKTNQFNFTTIRHSRDELVNFISSSEYDVFDLKVSDRFGDYGLTGVIIIKKEDNSINIISFLMSCRVIGKRIENVLIPSLLQKYYYGLDIEAIYRETKKNTQLKSKYEELGFKIVNQEEDTIFYKFQEVVPHELNLEIYYV